MISDFRFQSSERGLGDGDDDAGAGAATRRAAELAEDPSGGVQVRVLMDSNVVSGVTVVPLQQGGCCD